MSGELVGIIGFITVFISAMILVFSMADYFPMKSGNLNYGIDQVTEIWGATIFATFLAFVGFGCMLWSFIALDLRGYSEHDFTVKVTEVSGKFSPAYHAELDLPKSPVMSVHPAIEELQKEGLNKRFNQQFTDGQKLRLRIYERYVGGLSFHTRVELAEDKNG